MTASRGTFTDTEAMNGKGALDTTSGPPRHLYFYLERV